MCAPRAALFDFEPAGLFCTFREVCWLPFAPLPLLAGGTLRSRRAIMAPDGLRRGLNEHDPDLGIVTPDRLACSSGVTSLHEDENRGNAGCGLNLEASAGL